MYPGRETVLRMPCVVAAVRAAPYGDLLLARAKRGECLTDVIMAADTATNILIYTEAHLCYTG